MLVVYHSWFFRYKRNSRWNYVDNYRYWMLIESKYMAFSLYDGNRLIADLMLDSQKRRRTYGIVIVSDWTNSTSYWMIIAFCGIRYDLDNAKKHLYRVISEEKRVFQIEGFGMGGTGKNNRKYFSCLILSHTSDVMII